MTAEALRRCASASRSGALAAGPGKIRTHYEQEALGFERRAAAIEGAQRDHQQRVAEQRHMNWSAASAWPERMLSAKRSDGALRCC